MLINNSPDQSMVLAPIRQLDYCWQRRANWETGPWNLRGDSVSVRNLHAETTVGFDIWGRQKTQPVKISMTVWPPYGFESAARSDELDGSTVSYGVLSKELRQAIANKPAHVKGLLTLSRYLWEDIECLDSTGNEAVWSLELLLPKASAVGKGVSFTSLVGRVEETLYVTTSLHLRELTIATIVGINPHEREMKQLVVVSVWIEGMEKQSIPDTYGMMEQIVVKVCRTTTMPTLLSIYLFDIYIFIFFFLLMIHSMLSELQTVEEAAAKTLESLATKVISNLLKLCLFHYDEWVFDVRVKIDKPSAVIDADAAGVEMTRSSDLNEGLAKIAWEECGKRIPTEIEFPIKGRLDDWMRQRGIK